MAPTLFIALLIIPNVWFAFLPTAVPPRYPIKSTENLFQPGTAGWKPPLPLNNTFLLLTRVSQLLYP